MIYRLSNTLQKISLRLRKEFDTIMKDAHSPDRFHWDWWHLPGRYTHLRTPVESFFSPAAVDQLTNELLSYGRKHLGCQNISPLWLSCYVEGCEQRLHADRPHGPWAFVLSLTPEDPIFQGGETMFIRPEILSLWSQGVPAGQAFEEAEIIERVESKPGRLVVFDPRIPHGVSRVSGTLDARKGRLVVHGWFTYPSPFVDGPLTPAAAENSLTEFDSVLASVFQSGFESTGTAAFQISITPSGRVSKIRPLASSLIHSEPKTVARETKRLAAAVENHFKKWKFPAAKKSRTLTLPLSFER